MASTPNICALIPTFNNAGTVADVVRRTLERIGDVMVVNDGSTDDTLEQLEPFKDRIILISYPQNKGKGGALKEGFREALKRGFTHAVTLDSDGQHFPEDLPAILEAIAADPEALIVGSRNLRSDGMPGGNTFANRFSNFWFSLYTLQKLPDTQTGFRAYPLNRLPSLKVLTARYEAELELLVLSAWRGVRLRSVPVRVAYPEDRVSSFRPGADFARISLVNTVFLPLALLYGWPATLLHRLK